MKSILEGRPGLSAEVEKIAEVAGYLWQNGWAERNGGNITVNVTEFADDEMKQMPAISDVKQIGVTLPALKGCYFYCKGTGKRMRDLARRPMDNGSVTPICFTFLTKDVLTNILWSMIPETKAFCPLGLGVVPYELPGSNSLADATLKELEDYDVVLWEKHGVFAKGLDVMDAFDQIDVLSKSAKIYIDSRCMGFEPEGMSQEQLQKMTKAFNLPK